MPEWRPVTDDWAGAKVRLATWVADAEACVDPYWLIAEATNFRAFARSADAALPVLLEERQAPPGGWRFVPTSVARASLQDLIDRSRRGEIVRFQLGAPRTAGIAVPPVQPANDKRFLAMEAMPRQRIMLA